MSPRQNKFKKLTQNILIRELANGISYLDIATKFGITKNALYLHIRRMREKGLEPSDPNALRRHMFGPTAKPWKPVVSHPEPTPLHLQVLGLINHGYDMHEIRHMVPGGWQTLKNTTCEAFKRIGIDRKRKPVKVWKSMLRAYLQTRPVTMDDPFFN